jgi:hypothetical protein
VSTSVELVGQHSAAKDHVAMTGGTLSADKVVRGDSLLVLQHEFFPVTRVRMGSADGELLRAYSGVHSIEHALASAEGGDLRGRVEDVVREEGDGGGASGIAKQVVDMSPYVVGALDADDASELLIGFRSTFVSDGELLPRKVLAEAYSRSLRLVRDLFAGGGAVPFSTPEACGQYNLHSAEAGVELIDAAGDVASAEVASAEVAESGYGGGVVEVGARELYVCDLRLVKPRLAGAFDQRVLDVLAGHYISQAVEAGAWRSIDGGQPGTATAGNFGCSTGEYLMVGNPGGLGRDALLREAHVAVAKTLAELGAYAGGGVVREAAASDARFALEHIARHRPDVGAMVGAR